MTTSQAAPAGLPPRSEPVGALDVWIANSWFYPAVVGPGERFRRYAPGLRERGVKLRVFTVQFPNLPANGEIDGIPIRRIPIRGSKRRHERMFVYALLPGIAKGKDRPHVVQMFSYSHWSLLFVVALRALRIPVVLVFTMLQSEETQSTVGRLQALVRRLLFRPYSRIVTSSEVMTAELRNMGIPAARILTIPNGVNLQRFRPATSPAEQRVIRQRLGLRPEGKVALFVGSLHPRKGVDVLVRAWDLVLRTHPAARLLIVGSRPGEEKFTSYLGLVDGLIADCLVPESVICTGPVPNVEDFMRAADIFVFPSEREGMPNVVPEAMATGLPCVVTPFIGLPAEFGTPGQHYLLTERSPEALAEEIDRLLEDDVGSRELGVRAREWVESSQDVELSLDRFAALYRQLAKPLSHS